MFPDHLPLKEGALKYLELFNTVNYPVKLLGVRGYFKKTLGNPDSNDVGIYDDAIFIISDTYFGGFNANTDPSKIFPKVAILKTGGPYLYKIGMHNMKHPYEALRQWGNVTVLRNGIPVTDSPGNRFYIDIHKGGYGTTSSLGCQTIHPIQWMNFLNAVKDELRLHKQEVIPYILAENA